MNGAGRQSGCHDSLTRRRSAQMSYDDDSASFFSAASELDITFNDEKSVSTSTSSTRGYSLPRSDTFLQNNSLLRNSSSIRRAGATNETPVVQHKPPSGAPPPVATNLTRTNSSSIEEFRKEYVRMATKGPLQQSSINDEDVQKWENLAVGVSESRRCSQDSHRALTKRPNNLPGIVPSSSSSTLFTKSGAASTPTLTKRSVISHFSHSRLHSPLTDINTPSSDLLESRSDTSTTNHSKTSRSSAFSNLTRGIRGRSRKAMDRLFRREADNSADQSVETGVSPTSESLETAEKAKLGDITQSLTSLHSEKNAALAIASGERYTSSETGRSISKKGSRKVKNQVTSSSSKLSSLFRTGSSKRDSGVAGEEAVGSSGLAAGLSTTVYTGGYLYKPLTTRVSNPYQGDKEKLKSLRKWTCVTEICATPHPEPILVCKFSPCGRLLATAGRNGTIWIWVLKQFREYFDRGCCGEEQRTTARQQPLTSSLKSSLRSSETDPDPFGGCPFTMLIGHESEVYDISWSAHQGKVFLISASRDETVLLWSIGTAASDREPLLTFEHKEPIIAVWCVHDVRHFISVTFKGVIRYSSSLNKTQRKCLTVNLPRTHQVTSAALANNCRTVIIGTSDGRIFCYDIVSTTATECSLQLGYEFSVSKSKKSVKIDTIRVYTPKQGQQTSTVADNFNAGIVRSHPSSYQHYDNIIVTSNDKKIRIYDCKDWSVLATFKGFSLNLEWELDGAGISPDHKIIQVAGLNGEVFLFPYSSSEHPLTHSQINSLPGNQFFNPGYTSKSWVAVSTSTVDSDEKSANNSRTVHLTTTCMAPRVDFFTDFFKQYTHVKFDQIPRYIAITTDTEGKVRILVNAHQKSS